jgi:hypothetical protein
MAFDGGFLGCGPTGCGACHHAGDLVLGACRGVDVGRPQLRHQQVAAAEEVEQFIATDAALQSQAAEYVTNFNEMIASASIKQEGAWSLRAGSVWTTMGLTTSWCRGPAR